MLVLGAFFGHTPKKPGFPLQFTCRRAAGEFRCNPLRGKPAKNRLRRTLALKTAAAKNLVDKSAFCVYYSYMIERILIDVLNFKAKFFAERWKDQIRKEGNLKQYNALSDELLLKLSECLFPQLGRFLENGFDRSVLGGFFVQWGKNSVLRGFPLSETVYGLRLGQQIVLEYMQGEFVLDNPVVLYQTLSLVPRVADFFLLGCYYINKGFQEATIEKMVAEDKISKDILIKYFKDDFFFKKE